jgi:hypothetical protein
VLAWMEVQRCWFWWLLRDVMPGWIGEWSEVMRYGGWVVCLFACGSQVQQ